MITSTKINTVQEKIKRALEQIEREEQVKIKFGTCSYDKSMYRTQMKVTTTAQDDRTVNAVEEVNTRTSRSYGFSENIIGKTFPSSNGVCTIIEFKTRNRRYPILAKCTNGLTYKYSVGQIRMKGIN